MLYGLLVVAALIVGCGSAPLVDSQVDPQVDPQVSDVASHDSVDVSALGLGGLVPGSSAGVPTPTPR